jgi:hypothetical protein
MAKEEYTNKGWNNRTVGGAPDEYLLGLIFGII